MRAVSFKFFGYSLLSETIWFFNSGSTISAFYHPQAINFDFRLFLFEDAVQDQHVEVVFG